MIFHAKKSVDIWGHVLPHTKTMNALAKSLNALAKSLIRSVKQFSKFAPVRVKATDRLII